jgi:hypothetical protein
MIFSPFTLRQLKPDAEAKAEQNRSRREADGRRLF